MENVIVLYYLFLTFLVIYRATACDRCVHQSRAAYFSPSAVSGTCGYGSMVTGLDGYYAAAGSSHLYRDSVGCGACFQIRCKHQSNCNTDGVKVVLTGLNTKNNQSDFLINGQAFMSMAQNGMTSELMKLSIVDVEYKRIPCEYKNKNILIRVEEKSKNPDHLAIKFLYQGGQTDILAVDVAQVGSLNWQFMSRDHGPVWSSRQVPAGPLQLRMVVTGGFGGSWVWAQKEVLPQEWKIGSVYDLGVQITDVAHESCSNCVSDDWK